MTIRGASSASSVTRRVRSGKRTGQAALDLDRRRVDRGGLLERGLRRPGRGPRRRWRSGRSGPLGHEAGPVGGQQDVLGGRRRRPGTWRPRSTPRRPIPQAAQIGCSATVRTASRARSATRRAPPPSVPGQDERELVAAVAEDVVGFAAGVEQRVGDRPEEPVAGLVAELVVDRPEVVEVEHDQAERRRPRATRWTRNSWNVPWLSRPVRSSERARISTARWISALWRAIETCAANSLTSSNSSSLKRSLAAEPLEGQHAGDALAAAQRDDDQAAVGRPGRVELEDPRIGQLVDDELRLVVLEDPGRQARSRPVPRAGGSRRR